MLSLQLLGLLVSVAALSISAIALVRSRKVAKRQLELEKRQADPVTLLWAIGTSIASRLIDSCFSYWLVLARGCQC